MRGQHGVFDQLLITLSGEMPLEDERPAVALRVGLIAGGFDEAGELFGGDRVSVDPEWVDADLAHGAFAVGGEASLMIGTHQELAALKTQHAFG